MEIGNIKIEWIGHATFRIYWKGKVIYIDPFVLDKEEKADYVFITHEHFDHCDLNTLKRILKENTLVICPKVCENKVKRVTKNIFVVEPGKEYSVRDLEFETVFAYNVNKPFHPKGRGVGYVLDLNGVRIYHSGDTDLIPEMKELKDITVALLPIGGTYTMDYKEAIEAVKIIKPKYFIPMHYNYLPELKIDPSVLEELKKELEGVTEVIILEPLVK